MTIKLAHISDVHISRPLETISRMWTSKRLMGGMNMLLFRRRELRTEYFPRVVEHILSQAPDMVMLSGDISTTALLGEFTEAKEMLKPLIDAGKLVTIPGNHDVYTHGAQHSKRYESVYQELHGDTLPGHGYPFVREVGDKVAILGLNSCVPTGLSGSWGELDKEQLERLPELLLKHVDRFRVIMIHHFLQDKHGEPGLPRRGLRNRKEFMRVLASYGAEMIVHGHEHACYTYTVPGKQREIPVFSPGPATRHSHNPIEQGGYQLYEIEGGQISRIIRHHYDPRDKRFHHIQTN